MVSRLALPTQENTLYPTWLETLACQVWLPMPMALAPPLQASGLSEGPATECRL